MKKTVLVVDDEFDLSSTLAALLEGEGYHTATCSDGRAALDLLAASRPDLVLMDVMLPVMSGLEVLRTMKQTPGLDGVPVVLMSAVAPAVRREDYGWRAFLRKPFSFDTLVRTVGGLIGKPERAPSAN